LESNLNNALKEDLNFIINLIESEAARGNCELMVHCYFNLKSYHYNKINGHSDGKYFHRFLKIKLNYYNKFLTMNLADKASTKSLNLSVQIIMLYFHLGIVDNTFCFGYSVLFDLNNKTDIITNNETEIMSEKKWYYYISKDDKIRVPTYVIKKYIQNMKLLIIKMSD